MSESRLGSVQPGADGNPAASCSPLGAYYHRRAGDRGTAAMSWQIPRPCRRSRRCRGGPQQRNSGAPAVLSAPVQRVPTPRSPHEPAGRGVSATMRALPARRRAFSPSVHLRLFAPRAGVPSVRRGTNPERDGRPAGLACPGRGVVPHNPPRCAPSRRSPAPGASGSATRSRTAYAEITTPSPVDKARERRRADDEVADTASSSSATPWRAPRPRRAVFDYGTGPTDQDHRHRHAQ